MAKQMDLLRDRPSSLYFRYLVPSVSASLVTSIYILADTIMIGRGCGAEALAALNLVLPVFAVLFASGTLFGVGGGVLYSVARGNGDDERAQGIWSTAVLMVVGGSAPTHADRGTGVPSTVAMPWERMKATSKWSWIMHSSSSMEHRFLCCPTFCRHLCATTRIPNVPWPVC